MTDTLWGKALKKSSILKNYLKSEQLAQELGEVTGDSKIRKLTPESVHPRAGESLLFLTCFYLNSFSCSERVV